MQEKNSVLAVYAENHSSMENKRSHNQIKQYVKFTSNTIWKSVFYTP